MSGDENKLHITEKEKDICQQIISLEKYNNKVDQFTNQEMVTRIIDIIKKGVSDEV